MLRFSLLASATVAAALAFAGLASGAVLESAYDFHNGSLTASFDRSRTALPALVAPGVTGRSFDASEGYTASVYDRYAYGIVMSFRFTDGAGSYRVLDLSGGASADGLYVKGGSLAWQREGAADAVAAAPQLLSTTELNHVKLNRTWTGVLSVHVLTGDGWTKQFEVASGPTLGQALRLFHGDGAGEIGRLRIFDEPIDGPQSPLDTTAPSEPVFVDLGDPMVDIGGERWIGPRGYFRAQTDDDGSGPLDYDFQVFDGAEPKSPLLPPLLPFLKPFALDTEVVRTWVDGDLELGHLTHEGRYTLRLRLRDHAGNERTHDKPFRVDTEPPRGLSIETAAMTDQRVPTVEGRATVGARDAVSVVGQLCDGPRCDFGTGDKSGDVVRRFIARVVDGRWRAPSLETPRGRDGGDLPLGEYVIKVRHTDRVGNETDATKALRIVQRLPEPPPVQAPVPARPAPVVVPRPLLTPAALLQRAAADAIRALRRDRLNGLTWDSKGEFPVETDQPGEFVVQLFAAYAPKHVDVAARAAAKRRRRTAARRGELIATGRRAFAGPGAGAVTARLSARGARLLDRRRSAKLAIRTIFVPRGGAPVAHTATVVLKR